MQTYNNIMSAVKILKAAQLETLREFGCTNNPAWDKLYHATRHLTAQAAAILAEGN